MKKFMELLECDFRSGENKYCLLKSPEGFTSFQIHEDYGKIFWIRDDPVSYTHLTLPTT